MGLEVPAFAATATFLLEEGATLEITAFDDDGGAAGETMAVCTRDPVTSDTLALPGLCSPGGSQEGTELAIRLTLVE